MAPVGGVVDISSDEEDFLISDGLGSIDPAGWMADLFDVDDDATGEDFDDLMVMSEISAPPVLQQTAKADDLVFMSGLSKPALQKKANADGGCDEDEDDDECVVLDGDPDKAVTIADEEGSAGDGSSDELQIVAEKGPVACRDFPHSRHLCSNLPFSTTSHVKHCAMCHCFVCDTPAPCKYWGNSTSSNDHCHATDKEPKWKLMRQVFRSTQLPSSAPEKFPNDLYSTRHFAASQLPPSSLLHAGHPPLAIQSPLLNEGSQNQQRHHSVRVSLSVGGTVSSPRAGRGTCSAHIAQNTHSRAIFKRAGAVSPGFASKNASQFGAGCPDNSVMHQALPHVSQAAQVAPTTNAFTGTGTAQNNPFQRSFSAPIAYQVQQGQPGAYYQVAANGMDVIEPQLSRCTSLITERTQCLPEPVTDVGTKSWEDILATVASDLGVADYNISTTESPHVMTDSQPVHPIANQGFGLQHESVAAMENLMSSHMHDLSSHTTVSNVQANGPQEITENWDISGSSPVPNEAHLNDFASTPADVLSVEAAAHQLEVSRLDSTDILFEFDWS